MKKTRNSNRIKKQLGLSAAAIAGCAFGGVDNASADIITTHLNTVIPIPQNFAGVYLNLEDGLNGASPAAAPGWDFNPYQNGANGLYFFWNTGAGGVATGTNYSALPIGTIVDGTSTFSNTLAGTVGTPFQTGGLNYLGFRFNNLANVINYGYMLIESTAGTGGGSGFPATIRGWAYENSGAGIAVGAVPEPGVGILGALAMGAVVARRRRQSA